MTWSRPILSVLFLYPCAVLSTFVKSNSKSLLRYRLSRDNIITVWFCFQRFHHRFYNSLCFLNIKQPFANDHAVRKLKINCALVSLFATINKTRSISTLQQALKLKQRTKCVQRWSVLIKFAFSTASHWRNLFLVFFGETSQILSHSIHTINYYLRPWVLLWTEPWIKSGNSSSVFIVYNNAWET